MNPVRLARHLPRSSKPKQEGEISKSGATKSSHSAAIVNFLYTATTQEECKANSEYQNKVGKFFLDGILKKEHFSVTCLARCYQNAGKIDKATHITILFFIGESAEYLIYRLIV